jgi:hypothetical protein
LHDPAPAPARRIFNYELIEEIRMAKYSKTASKKVKRAMHERKRGELKSGKSGKTVKSRKQAIAIGLSEARRAGAKVPAAKSSKKSGGRSGAKKSSKKSTKKSSKKSRKRTAGKSANE